MTIWKLSKPPGKNICQSIGYKNDMCKFSDYTVPESGIDVPLMLIDNWIGHKGILLLNELPFSIHQEVPLMLLDICIGYKGIWLLNLWFFYLDMTLYVVSW